uniref:Uncharacterized protein n=1 Tax=Anguilla anguilla TaxID=7936 RepID=A0A0E9QCN2_ANGAN
MAKSKLHPGYDSSIEAWAINVDGEFAMSYPIAISYHIVNLM